MKTILVTGSEGYLGTIMVPYFLEKGLNVIGLDSCYFAEGNLDKSKRPNYKLIKKDIRDVVKRDLDGVNAIVHLAGLSNDPLGMLDESLTYEINHAASVDLAKLAKECGIDRFIFSSSCSLYGKGDGAALTEKNEQNPQTAYAKSKVRVENDLAKLADDKFCPVYMRNATAFGFSPRMRFDLVVNSLSGFAHTLREIKILGDGKPWRPLVHAKDIAKAFYLAIQVERGVVFNQAFNVGDSRENYQIIRIADLVKEIAYPQCQIKIMQKDAGDTRDYNVSFEKIKKELGFEAEWSVPRGIREICDVFMKIDLSKSEFESKNYTRLKQIRHLLDSGAVNKNLHYA